MAVAEPPGRQARVLLLADDRRDHAATLLEHIDAIRTLSRHDVRVYNPRDTWRNRLLDLDEFDVVVVHYSLMILAESYLPADLRGALSRFGGLKIQFIQDDYRQVEAMRAAMRTLGIHVLFTLVPEREIERVWPASSLPGVTVLSTLAGYVPEAAARRKVPALDERPLDVGYRGRPLPAWLGLLGQEKKWIAEGFAEHAARHGLRTNIAWQEDARIYGSDWFEFISSCRVTLGTESGASITDFDGSLERRVAEFQHEYPDADFQTIHDALLQPYEGNVMMNVISPRIFEAIALRTGLVLFPGEYSGILVPDRHYIPLAKDFSNADEVIQRIRDTEALDAMIRRAYTDIVASGRYSYAKLVRSLDQVIDARATVRRRPLVRFHAARAERALRAVERQPPRQVRRVARVAAAGRFVARDPAVRRLAAKSLTRRALPSGARRNLALDLLRLALLRAANEGRLHAGTPFVLDSVFDPETGALNLVSVAAAAPTQLVEVASSPEVPVKLCWHHAAVGEAFVVPLTKRLWATFPVDTTSSSPTHDFAALESVAAELQHEVEDVLVPFWTTGDAEAGITRVVNVGPQPTTPSTLALPLRILVHPRFYTEKALFSLDALKRHPELRTLLDAARRRGSWQLAARAFPEVMKLYVLALARAGRVADVAAVRADTDGTELRFVSLAGVDANAPAPTIEPFERLVWDNSAVSRYVVATWKGTEITFGLGPDGRIEFPILSSLVQAEPRLARTILSLLGRHEGAEKHVTRVVAGDR